MKAISNSDYKEATRLLRHLSTTKGTTIREINAARRAALLVRKWNRHDTK